VPLHILAIAPTGFFADYGCHVRIRGQLAALAARGHYIQLVTYPNGRDVDGLATSRPFLWPKGRHIPVGSSRRKLLLDGLLLPTAIDATRRFPGGRPHLIHAYLHEGALIGAWLASWLRVPLVFDFQGSLTSEMLDHRFVQPGSAWLSPLRWLERWINRQPQAVLASSHYGAQLLVSCFGLEPARVHAVPDSIDPLAFRPRAELDQQRLAALRRRLGVPADRPLLVYLGLLAPYQGTDILLAALARLAQEPCFPYSLIMGFPDVDHYRDLAARLGLASHITFTGQIPYEQAPWYLALGDVAVAPKLSATEGSGKLLTYMAAGLPVVAFDTPVHREYLGDLGRYAPPGDAGSLAAAIRAALEQKDTYQSQGKALRACALASYTWQHAADQIEAVYASLQSL